MTKPIAYHVFAIPTDANGTYEAIDVDCADTADEALTMVAAAGYRIIPEGDGGTVETYDADDAPGVVDFDRDGFGAIGVTVEVVTPPES